MLNFTNSNMYFLAILFLLLSVVNGKLITGIFTSIDSIVHSGGLQYYSAAPINPSWIVSMSWAFDGDMVAPGDNFNLNMPCVFKFTTAATSINLVAGSRAYATCTFAPGELVVPYSQLNCVILPTVQAKTRYRGQISFPVTFNIGYSTSSVDLTCASRFSTGLNSVINTVTFNDGSNSFSTTANFQGGQIQSSNPNSILYYNKIIPSLNKQQQYLLAGACPNGYVSGTIGMTISNGIDCKTAVQAMTNNLNTWYFPISATVATFSFQCSANQFTVTYKNIPAGYRPFISVFTSPQNGQVVRITYTNTYLCALSTNPTDNSLYVDWGIFSNAGTDSNGAIDATVITSSWGLTTTGITTLPFTSGGTKTIVVQVPTPSKPVVTITTTWDKPTTETTTLPFTRRGTKTIVVQVPTPSEPVVTVTTTWDKPTTETTTLPFTSGGTKTIVVQVPTPSEPVVTVTNTWYQSTTDTTTLPFSSGGTKTIVVQVSSSEFSIKFWNSTIPQSKFITVTTSSHGSNGIMTGTEIIRNTATAECDTCSNVDGSNPGSENGYSKPSGTAKGLSGTIDSRRRLKSFGILECLLF
jgi:hypothetical protein